MKLGFSFNEGLQILNIVCDVLETDKMVNFMRKNNSQALNIVLNKIKERNASKTEISLILTLLLTYAKSIQGSIHLNQLKILEKIESVCTTIENENLYQFDNNRQIRNPLHIQWLQILVLIRQMNTNLLQSPRSEHIDYFKKQCTFVNRLKHRFIQMLEVCLGNNLTQSASQTNEYRNPVITLAILEEIEIICSLVSQLFEHADFWAEKDYNTYCDYKDCFLIAVPQIISYQVQQGLIASSNTENQLLQIKQNDRGLMRSALSLKLEQSFIRTMLTCASGLYNVCSLNPESKKELLNTWSNLHQDLNQTSFVSQFLSQNEGPLINCAFENFRSGMENLYQIFNEFNGDLKQEIRNLVTKTAKFLKNDVSIVDELSADISALLVEESFEELNELIEISLQMGMFVLTTLLEQIQQMQENQGIGWINQAAATPYDKLRMKSQRNSQAQFLQDNNLQNQANQLQKLIQLVTQSLKIQQKNQSISYLEFLHEKAVQIGNQLGQNNNYI